MSMRLFQDSCAYVGRKCHLLEGLTTKQTLYYAAHLTIGTIFSYYITHLEFWTKILKLKLITRGPHRKVEKSKVE